MLLQKEKTCLVLVDVQEKLIPLIHNHSDVVNRCQWLMRLARELSVPCVVSEQYPRGLGHTVPELLQDNHSTIIEKVHFSCWREPSFKNELQTINRDQIVLIGIETHVCVLQTAIDLHDAGFQVFVVVDAVGSRNELDYRYGLKRMKQTGVHLVTSEMVFFEWVEKAGSPEFKALSQSYLK
ncbi:hydrolase [Legionella dresdenensis]|uniref:Hydrolase n=1 Tax=Legionella dresdenensis TaxID=450200 RepID=A0ABV8CEV9_9GAMM